MKHPALLILAVLVAGGAAARAAESSATATNAGAAHSLMGATAAGRLGDELPVLQAAGRASLSPRPSGTNAPAGGPLSSAGVPEAAHFDGTGRLRLLSVAGDPVPVIGEIRIGGPDWAFTGASNPWSATGVTFAAESNGVSAWTGFIPLDNGGLARYEQRVKALPSGAAVTLAVTAETDLAIDGIYYFLQFPVRAFAEAQAVLWRGTAAVARAELPAVFRSDSPPQFLQNGAADRVVIQAEPYTVAMTLDRACGATLQDDRDWGTSSYSLFVPLARGPVLRRGETARLRFEVTMTGVPDRTPAEITVKPDALLELFEGFGGNFIYGLDTPVATALVARLAPARARIEMALFDWEPENDNASPTETDWAKFEARDMPGSELRRRFELAALLAGRGVPLVISVWDLPEWMYEGQPRGRWASRRTVSPDKWPEVLESAGAYLLHLKKRYGVEPELFSFNEPETGVRVLLSSEQHRESIRRFGPYFAQLGLKTRALLADVASPRESESYGVYALSDPAALPFIGAVAFHSWGGATPLEYAAWAALARRAGLPLMVTELGWDPASWRTPDELKTPFYAVQELKMIQDVLAYSRPRAALFWEYSDDYPLLMPQRGADGRETLTETARLRFLDQLNRLTPRPARALETASSRADVAVTGFRAGTPEGKPALVLHVANTGAPRKAVIAGWPAAVASVETSAVLAAAPGAVRGRAAVKGGRAEVDLPAWSLVSVYPENP